MAAVSTRPRYQISLVLCRICQPSLPRLHNINQRCIYLTTSMNQQQITPPKGEDMSQADSRTAMLQTHTLLAQCKSELEE
jgi:hypothetical protein